MHLNQFKINNMHAAPSQLIFSLSVVPKTTLMVRTSFQHEEAMLMLPLEVLSLSGGGVGVSEC